ncbi:hypothetical protein [Hespellia stercorisuis]|uniref:Transposase, YhgA-like n=1 Tax=Hespellia stercorisuis DSM 15480 TaxID=1121950 RepID=A0A1M6NWD2_9FIRM|nr:hypothetical protein [Hespellia stercorisuis]SHK00059.1 hypothetical protein SAMN02745243_01942 [Hespellia stercorisuis DSM 15480]
MNQNKEYLDNKQENEPKANREHKSSMFTDLYMQDDGANARDIELYNALHEEQLPLETKVKKMRVDKTLYMNFENDSSFGVEDKILIFSEQQSTINANMPLRNLMYCGRAYEQIVPVKDRYKKQQVKIPKPEFYTFYNGLEWKEKETVLRISDAFQVQDDDPTLELQVKVININPDIGHDLPGRCPTLKEYGIFIDTIRKYQESEGKDDLSSAIEKAIEECVNRGILVGYLEKKGSEVRNMLIAEYDYDMDIEVQREEAHMLGKAEGKAEDILELLEEYGTVPGEFVREIREQKDLEILKRWLKIAARVNSVQEFEEKIK